MDITDIIKVMDTEYDQTETGVVKSFKIPEFTSNIIDEFSKAKGITKGKAINELVVTGLKNFGTTINESVNAELLQEAFQSIDTDFFMSEVEKLAKKGYNKSEIQNYAIQTLHNHVDAYLVRQGHNNINHSTYLTLMLPEYKKYVDYLLKVVNKFFPIKLDSASLEFINSLAWIINPENYLIRISMTDSLIVQDLEKSLSIDNVNELWLDFEFNMKTIYEKSDIAKEKSIYDYLSLQSDLKKYEQIVQVFESVIKKAINNR